MSSEKNFSAEELVRILRACRSARVSELKIGSIEVKFESGETLQISGEKSEVKPLPDKEFKAAVSDNLVRENVESAEDKLSLMQIEDPALYEQLVIEGELGDGTDKAHH